MTPRAILFSLLMRIVACSASDELEFLKKPLIDAYSPRGLRVSVPHVSGMQHFSFHGKINSRSSEDGDEQISHDITRPRNDRWEFQDDDRELHVGDVIHFWIFVQKDGMGRRFDDLTFTVKELLSRPTKTMDDAVSYRSPSEDRVFRTDKEYVPRSAVYNPLEGDPDQNCDSAISQLNASHILQTARLQDQIYPLQNKVKSLTELVEDLIKDMHVGRKLRLIGKPPRTDPVEAVRQLITEKLFLGDLDERILQAEVTSDGIAFEMSSAVDKKRILFRAKTHLKNSKYNIIDPDVDEEQDRSGRRQPTTRRPQSEQRPYINQDNVRQTSYECRETPSDFIREYRPKATTTTTTYRPEISYDQYESGSSRKSPNADRRTQVDEDVGYDQRRTEERSSLNQRPNPNRSSEERSFYDQRPTASPNRFKDDGNSYDQRPIERTTKRNDNTSNSGSRVQVIRERDVPRNRESPSPVQKRKDAPRTEANRTYSKKVVSSASSEIARGYQPEAEYSNTNAFVAPEQYTTKRPSTTSSKVSKQSARKSTKPVTSVQNRNIPTEADSNVAYRSSAVNRDYNTAPRQYQQFFG